MGKAKGCHQRLLVAELPRHGVAGQEEMQQMVGQRFQELKDATWHTVDAARSIGAVESDVTQIAETAVETCRQGRPLQYLWL